MSIRYLVHLYPLCAIIVAWIILKVWRYDKISGVLLAFLLCFTNWLYLIPMDWLQIINRPIILTVECRLPQPPPQALSDRTLLPLSGCESQLHPVFSKSGSTPEILF